MSKKCKWYLIWTFAITGFSWGICVLCSLWGKSLADMPILYVPYLLGGLSPTIASFLVVRENGLKAWLRSVFDPKHAVVSYLMLPVLAAIFFLPQCLIGGYEKGAPLFMVVFMVPVMLFGGGLEETGWRGILQPELEARLGRVVSTVIVGIVWWVWHLPLFFIRGVAQYGADFFGFGIDVMALSFALASIRRNTGSILLCVLFHCLINSLHGVYILGQDIMSQAIAAVVLIVVCCVWDQVQKKTRVFR